MKFIARKGRIDNRLASLALVVAAHALIVYALAGGLTWFSASQREHPIEIKIIGAPALPAAPVATASPPAPTLPREPRRMSREPRRPQMAALAAPSEAAPTAHREQPSKAEAPSASAAERSGGAPQQAARASDAPAAPRTPLRVPASALAKDCATPEYPRKSYRYNEEGTVTLALLIGADGHVVESRVEKSSGFKDLDHAALAALSLCKFKPGTVDGKPEPSWATLRYQWKIE